MSSAVRIEPSWNIAGMTCATIVTSSTNSGAIMCGCTEFVIGVEGDPGVIDVAVRDVVDVAARANWVEAAAIARDRGGDVRVEIDVGERRRRDGLLFLLLLLRLLLRFSLLRLLLGLLLGGLFLLLLLRLRLRLRLLLLRLLLGCLLLLLLLLRLRLRHSGVVIVIAAADQR